MSDPPPTAPDLRTIALAFHRRRRGGEELAVEAFLAAHPDAAAQLRPLLSALAADADATSDAQFDALFEKFVASELAATIGGSTRVEGTRSEGTRREVTTPEAGATERFDDRYRVLRVIGQGGFGKVYLVEDELHPGERLALKTIRVDRAADPQFEQRFRNEIRIMRALQHPGIPQIFNDGKTGDGEFFFTMAFLEGATLEEVLRAGKLPIERVVRLLRQMVSILEYAHARNVVHRDLKPANVFVIDPGAANEEVKILDFGIAKVLRREGALNAMESMNTLGSPGTPAYMAPEQMLGEEIDARTDVYALGVLLHRMLSGELPFSGTTPETRLRARLTGDLPPLTKEQAPEWLATLSARLLRPERGERPTLQEITRSLDAQAFVGKKLEKKGRGARPLVIAGIVVAIGAAAVWFWPKADDGAKRDGVPPVSPGVHEVPPKPADDGNGTATPAEPKKGGEEPAIAPVDPTPLAIAIDRIAGEAAFDSATPRFTKESAVTLAGSVKGAAGGDACVLTIDGKLVEVAADGSFKANVALANEGHNDIRCELADAAKKKTKAECKVAYVRDTKRPVVKFDPLANGGDATSLNHFEVKGDVEEEHPSELALRVGKREPILVRCDANGRFEQDVDLDDGQNEMTLVATDRAGNRSEEARCTIRRLGKAPIVMSISPANESTIAPDQKEVRVVVDSDQDLVKADISGKAFKVEGRRFDQVVALPAGEVTLTVEVWNADQQKSEPRSIHLVRSTLRAPPGFEPESNADAGSGGYAKAIVHKATKLAFVLVEPPSGGDALPGLSKPFFLGRHEVTREQYEKFCTSSNCKLPPADALIGAGKPNVPIVSIPIEDAERFCNSLSGEGFVARLPTTTEWEFAAGGAAKTAYPWGPEWRPGACNSGDDKSEKEQRTVAGTFQQLAAVGSFRDDRAPCGALDLAGNVSEWCRDAKGDPTKRGGNYLSSAQECTLAQRVGLPPRSGSSNLGFRVVVVLDH